MDKVLIDAAALLIQNPGVFGEELTWARFGWIQMPEGSFDVVIGRRWPAEKSPPRFWRRVVRDAPEYALQFLNNGCWRDDSSPYYAGSRWHDNVNPKAIAAAVLALAAVSPNYETWVSAMGRYIEQIGFAGIHPRHPAGEWEPRMVRVRTGTVLNKRNGRVEDAIFYTHSEDGVSEICLPLVRWDSTLAA